MDREKIAQTMEEVVRSYRGQLAKKDDSLLANIGNAAKMVYETFKTKMVGNEEEKHAIDMFKQYAEAFEDALKDGKFQDASKALDNMEKSIQAFRIKSYDTV